MDPTLHICFCFDKNWIQSARRTIYDIILRKFPETKIKFYILFDGTLEDKSLFDVFNKIEDIELVIEEIDASRLFEKDTLVSTPYLGLFKHIKFLIPSLEIFKDVDRVLYLDIDMLARKDLADLYNLNLNGYPLGAVRQPLYIGTKGFPDSIKVFDTIESSVLLMDLRMLRSIGFAEMCIGISKRKECTGDMYILKELSANFIRLLDPKYAIPYHVISAEKAYNDIHSWNYLYGTNYKSIDDLVERSYLWHFCGYKPLIYRCMPCVKACFDLSQKRLQRFLETGEVEKWSPKDDEILYTYHGYVKISEEEQEIKMEKSEPVLD